MELVLNRLTPDYIEKSDMQDLLADAYTLLKNFNSFIGKKMKLSFIPNTYYDRRIYQFLSYKVYKTPEGLSIVFELHDGEKIFQHIISNVIKLEGKYFFNRIEYKAFSASSAAPSAFSPDADGVVQYYGKDRCSEYNFCLYD